MAFENKSLLYISLECDSDDGLQRSVVVHHAIFVHDGDPIRNKACQCPLLNVFDDVVGVARYVFVKMLKI